MDGDPGVRVELLESAGAGADLRRIPLAAEAEFPAPDPLDELDPCDPCRETDVDEGADGPELDCGSRRVFVPALLLEIAPLSAVGGR